MASLTWPNDFGLLVRTRATTHDMPIKPSDKMKRLNKQGVALVSRVYGTGGAAFSRTLSGIGHPSARDILKCRSAPET